MTLAVWGGPNMGRESKWLCSPYILGDLQSGAGIKVATWPLHSWGLQSRKKRKGLHNPYLVRGGGGQIRLITLGFTRNPPKKITKSKPFPDQKPKKTEP